MFKLIIVSTLLAAASASYPLAASGYVSAPFAASIYGYTASPYDYAAPLPYATSYANTYKLSLRSPYAVAPPTYPAPASYPYPLPYAYGKAYGYTAY